MKAKIVITLAALALVGLAGAAQAGDRHHGYRDGHYRGHATAHQYRLDRYRRPYLRVHHYRSYGYPYYRHYGPRHGHYYHDHDGWKVAAGAVLLGSIIHSASRDRAERVVVRRHSEPMVAPASYNRDTWYRNDSNGDCFEVHLNSAGDEVWTLADHSYCN